MSHFYGSVAGCARTVATRRGHKGSGIITRAAGWQGAVSVYLHHDFDTNTDHYRVELGPWENSGGKTVLLARGVLDANSVE